MSYAIAQSLIMFLMSLEVSLFVAAFLDMVDAMTVLKSNERSMPIIIHTLLWGLPLSIIPAAVIYLVEISNVLPR